MHGCGETVARAAFSTRVRQSSVSKLRNASNSGVGIFRVQCCSTSTETVWTIRDGKPGTATSTFSQLLFSLSSVLLHVHRDRTDC